MRILAGDIGGTKTWLALYDVREGEAHEVRSTKFASADFPSLEDTARAFLKEDHADAAAFGIAGPVVGDTAKTTNLPWHIDARSVERDLGISKAQLLNDFHAVALGVAELDDDGLVRLQDNPVEPSGPVAILGAGTGLGEAVCVPSSSGTIVLPTEGGHVDFAPRTPDEVGLLQFLMTRHKRVSVERVVSGLGLAAIYDYVCDAKLTDINPEIRQAVDSGGDPAAIIHRAADAGTDPASERTLDIFVAAYGAEAGNFALKTLPWGGIFVAGGIAAKMIERLKNGLFLEAFLNKGRMSALLQQMRVQVVMDPKVGLLGARSAAVALLD